DLTHYEKQYLIVIDLILTGMHDKHVYKTLRQENMNTPILMLTTKDEEFDKILGLELCADDYMTKPFSPREVVARVKAILRRSQAEMLAEKADGEVITIGDLEIHLDKYDVYYKG